jgi:hypothetical protein
MNQNLTEILITDGAATDWTPRPVTVLGKFNRIRLAKLGTWGLILPDAERYIASIFFTPPYIPLLTGADLFADDRKILNQALFTASIPENMNDFTHELPIFPEGNYTVWTFPNQKGGLLAQLWYTD